MLSIQNTQIVEHFIYLFVTICMPEHSCMCKCQTVEKIRILKQKDKIVIWLQDDWKWKYHSISDIRFQCMSCKLQTSSNSLKHENTVRNYQEHDIQSMISTNLIDLSVIIVVSYVMFLFVFLFVSFHSRRMFTWPTLSRTVMS